jgi:hypothetical protein
MFTIIFYVWTQNQNQDSLGEKRFFLPKNSQLHVVIDLISIS